jgi:UDP-3-O-[3-hydroxymyristoyl] N-acetylglucosamine deacetylase
MTANAEFSDRRTVIIGESGERFEQIEHLMAAFAAFGITDAEVRQVGPEVPFLGGGSREYMEALLGAGTQTLGDETTNLEPLVITEPVSFTDGNAIMSATPHDGLRMSVFVEFPGSIIGNQGYSIELTRDSFFEEVSRARTFALVRDIEQLRAMGLIKGGNLSNAVIADADRYHNESLHYPDEVVRHKVIDLWGDLALLARPLRGHFWAWRAGHRSHVRFAQFLAREIFKLK